MKLDLRKVLPIISCVGTLATGALSAWGALKIKEHENDGRRKWLYAIPAVASAACTIAAIVFHNKNMTKELAIVTAGAAYLTKKEEAFKKSLQNDYHVEEEVLVEAESKAAKEAAACIYHNNETISIPSIEETGHGNLLVIEGWSGRAFRSSKSHVASSIKKFKAMYEVDHMSLPLNELYRLNGLRQTHFGWMWGFPCDAEETAGYCPACGELDIYLTYDDSPELAEPILFIEYGYDSYPIEGWFEY